MIGARRRVPARGRVVPHADARAWRWRLPLRTVVVLLGSAVAMGCATPIGVDPADPQEVYRDLTASAVSGPQPSAASRELLTQLGLRDRFHEEPDRVLEELHEGLGEGNDADLLYALAELSFLQARQTEDRGHALAAAVYAWAFLFGAPERGPPPAFDPRVGVARNVYNLGLTRGLSAADGTVTLSGGTYTLPFGVLDVTMDENEKVWEGRTLTAFRSATSVEVRGLANRYRQAGIGAPLSAVRGPQVGPQPPGAARVAPRLQVPATAVLLLPDVHEGLSSGQVAGQLRLFTDDEDTQVVIGDRVVPLERETSSSLAMTLEGAPIWEFGAAGFRLGDFLPVGQVEQLVFLKPYRPGRIPLVLVHGTFSHPATWAQVVNELGNDPIVSERYQIWLFLYNTGNPIAYSAGILRSALGDAVEELDPEGRDPALRRMVVVGHSQGGLLTKATAVRSGDAFWRNVSAKPLEASSLDPELQEMLRRSLFYEPLPFVERVVFLSTPHGGSYLSDFAPAAWVSRLVKMPLVVTRAVTGILADEDEAIRSRLARPPTSLDNMRAGNPYLDTLHTLPIDSRIHAHSIIAVQGDGPLGEEGDGVVRYPSAHLEGVASELVVRRSGHSVQERPEAIRELRRILLLHLDSGSGGG